MVTFQLYALHIVLMSPSFWLQAEDASFVFGVVVCCRCPWKSRPQNGNAQTCMDLVIRRCFGTIDVPGTWSTRDGVPEPETPPMRTAVLLFLNLTCDFYSAAPGAIIWRYGTIIPIQI